MSSLTIGQSDAVAALASTRLGMTKSELIGADATNAASNLAKAETAFLAEVRQYFETVRQLPWHPLADDL